MSTILDHLNSNYVYKDAYCDTVRQMWKHIPEFHRGVSQCCVCSVSILNASIRWRSSRLGPEQILRPFKQKLQDLEIKKPYFKEHKSTVCLSVADPRCLSRRIWLFLSRILIFPFRIPDPRFWIPDSGSASKNLSILTQKCFFKLSEIWSGLFIPDPHPGSGPWFYTHTGSRIPDLGGKKAPDAGCRMPDAGSRIWIPDTGSRIRIRNTGLSKHNAFQWL